MKKLFLVTFTLRVSTYMNNDDRDEDYSRLVWATDVDDAYRIISERKEFKTDEYSVYRNIRNFDAVEALGEEE